MKPRPNLRPISEFSLIRSMVEGCLENAKVLFANLKKAKDDSVSLEDNSFERATDLYTRELDIAYAFEEQIKKWKKETAKSDPIYSKIIQLEKDQKEYTELAQDIIDLATNTKEEDVEIEHLSNQERREIASKIDDKVKKLIEKNDDDFYIISNMSGYMNDFYRLVKSPKTDDMDCLIAEFSYFFRFAKIIEHTAQVIKDTNEDIEQGKIKVGRNEPCFCGSGKKFKKCCLLKVEEDIH